MLVRLSSLYAKGLSTGEISAHFADIYGAQVSKETISRITERVLDGVNEWSNWPLDEVYAVIFIDASTSRCVMVRLLAECFTLLWV